MIFIAIYVLYKSSTVSAQMYTKLCYISILVACIVNISHVSELHISTYTFRFTL